MRYSGRRGDTVARSIACPDLLRSPRMRDGIASLFLAVLVLGPALLLSGYVLQGDMVFVPEQPWKSTWLGADGSVPRAVPSDAVMAALGSVLSGSIVQKLLLVSTLALGGFGIARLVEDRSQLARLAAMTLFVWNPYVYARLAIGHWALLVGYAALPWVARAARNRRTGAGSWISLAVPLLAAAWSSPTGGVLAVLVAVLFLLPRPRLLPGLAVVAGLANLPWLLPGLLNSSGQPADPFGVSAFAARADTPWGVAGSLLSLGGMWKSSVEAPGRDSLLLSGVGMALVIAGLAGLLALRSRERSTADILLGCAFLGLILATLPTLGWGQQIVEWTVTQIPGGGLVRDSQKFVALTAVAASAGLAHGVDYLRARLTSIRQFPFGAIALLPVLVLPGLAWGLLGTLAPAHYPDEWNQVRTVMEEQDADERRTVVLPFSLYRRFDWNKQKAVLDPAPRFFPGEVLIDDALSVTDGTVAGEDPLAARIRAAADSPVELARVLSDEGVAWALVHKPLPEGEVLPHGEVVHQGDELALVRLDGEASARTSVWNRWVVAGSGASALFALVIIGMSVFGGIRAYTRSRENLHSRGGHA